MTKWVLTVILLAGFLVRIYQINTPLADWHSWRQADTSAVTRNFIKEGFNPFLPKFDDMSAVSSVGYPNPERYRFVEFPVYNIFVFPLYLIFGANIIFDRLVSIIFSLGSIIFIFLISRKYAGELIALIASLIFAILPFNVFFSRTTLPEPTLVFFTLGMIYFVDRWIWNSTNKNYWLALGFIVISFLIKPWSIFFTLPLIYSAIKKEKSLNIFRKRYILLLLGLIPFLLWRLWILQHPEGIPASDWLMNGDGIRFKPVYWYWIISERLGKEILGVTGVFLFFVGLILRPKNGNYFLHIWALSAFLFMIIFATGNVRHNYYQISFIPIAAIFMAIGFTNLLTGINNFIPRIWTITLALLFFPLVFYFTWNITKEFYKINNPVIAEVGKIADTKLPKDVRVVAPYNGDTALLYHINRPGFPVIPLPLTDLIYTYGVSYYISTSMDTKTTWVTRHFKVVDQTAQYVIADLTQLNIPFNDGDPEPN